MGTTHTHTWAAPFTDNYKWTPALLEFDSSDC